MTTTTILLIVSIVLLFGTCLAIYKLLKVIESYETLIDSYEEYLASLADIIETSNQVIQQVDYNGHFRTDDELETFFDAIKQIQKILNEASIKSLELNNQEGIST